MEFKRAVMLSLMILGYLVAPHIIMAREEPLFLFRGARPLGLGNAIEAIADDINALHYNPAGIAQIDRTLYQFLALRARITKDLADEFQTMQEFVNETILPLTDSDTPLTDPAVAAERQELVNRAEKILAKRLALDLGLPSFGLTIPVASNEHYKAMVGVSLYNQAIADLQVIKRGLPWQDPVVEALDNHVVYRVTAQMALATALAVRIPLNRPFLQTANLGVGVRFVRRGVFTDEDDPFEIIEILDTERFRREHFNLADDERVDEFVRANLQFTNGYSLDLGTLLTPVNGFKVGLALRNAINSISVKNETPDGVQTKVDRRFPRNLVVAFAAKPFEVLKSGSNLFDLTIAASLDNPNGDDGLGNLKLNSFTDYIHLGSEVVLWPQGSVSMGLRAGNNQGFLTYGITLRLFKFLNLHAARYANLETDWWVGSLEVSF